MIARRYTFKDNRSLFISSKTIKELGANMLAISNGELKDLEFVVNFQLFSEKKTGAAIGRWLVLSHEEKGIHPKFVGHHSTDGASNAVKSKEEYDWMTQLNRSTTMEHEKCHAHQNERSGRYASGTGDYVDNANEELSVVLRKCHKIMARLHRSEARLKILTTVQERNQRTKIRRPNPGVVTRWNSEHTEVAGLNVFMGDINKALEIMLAPGAIDEGLLKDSDGAAVDAKEHVFTPSDKMVLRQYECAAEPCILLSKFFQLNEPVSHEILFNMRARLQDIRSPSFKMFCDLSHSDVRELGKRLKTETVVASYIRECPDHIGGATIPMSPCIEKFRDLYADDLEFRLGLTTEANRDAHAEELPKDVAVACLLNPLYGGKLFLSSLCIVVHGSLTFCFLFLLYKVKNG